MGMTWEEFVDMYQYGMTSTKYMLTSVLGFFTDDLETYMKNNEAYWQYAVDFQNKYGDKAESGKDFEIDKEDVNNLYAITKDSVTALQGYFMIQPNLSLDDFLFQKNGISQKSIDYIKSVYNTHNIMFLDDTFNRLCYFSDETLYDYYYFSSSPNHWSFRGYNSTTGKGTYFDRYVYWNSVYSENHSNQYSFKKLYYVGTAPIRVFYSYDDMIKYINGYQPVYTGSVFNNFPINSGNVILDFDKSQNTDWDAVQKQMYDAVRKGLSDGMSEEEKQIVIDQQLDSILDEIGAVNDNGIKTNSLLASVRDILFKINDRLSSMANSLTDMIVNQGKLFNLFKDFSFEKLLDAIDKSGGSGGSGGSGSDSIIDDVIGSLLDALLDKINNGEASAEEAVSELIEDFSGIADTSKTKFPFCLPWDVMAVFTVLSSPPAVPYFKIPFEIQSIGFKYELILDLSEFQALSKLSRSFFVLIFCMILIRLTLLMINRGDLD